MSVFPLVAAFLLSLSLTPLGIALAGRMGLVDTPDGAGLKIHGRPIPNGGGLVLAASFLPVVLFFPYGGAGPGREVALVAAGALASLFLGLVDDIKGLTPGTRLSAQCLLGALVAALGLTPRLFSSPLADGLLAVVMVAGAMNAVNLLDGMDGLASGACAICWAAFAALSWLQGDLPVFVLASAVLAAFVGFLPYNFYPASIFLGNSGSSLAGFLLAGLMILSLRESPTPLGLAGSLLIAGLPAGDTGYAICRRIRAKKGIMTGDRDHFYDKLLRRGFSQRQSALIGYAAAAFFAASGLAILLAGG